MPAEKTKPSADIGAWLADLCAVAGGGLISFGAWQIYPPAGSIVGGFLLLAAGLAGVVRRSRY